MDEGWTPSASARVAGATLLVDRLAAEVFARLAEMGARGILLKGASTIRLLGEAAADAPYSDVDLLVPLTGIQQIEQLLTEMGYAPRAVSTIPHDRPTHAWCWQKPGAVEVDVHVSLPGVGVPPERLWGLLEKETEEIEIQGTGVPVLKRSARALHLALHASQHGRDYPEPLKRLAAAVERLPAGVWREAHRLSIDLQAAGSFRSGLRLVKGGDRLLADLGLQDETGDDGSSGPHSELARTLDGIVRTPGSGRRLLLLLRKLFPPRAYVRGVYGSGAERGAGLAYLYAERLIRIMWGTVPAVREVMRARREARRNHS